MHHARRRDWVPRYGAAPAVENVSWLTRHSGWHGWQRRHQGAVPDCLCLILSCGHVHTSRDAVHDPRLQAEPARHIYNLGAPEDCSAAAVPPRRRQSHETLRRHVSLRRRVSWSGASCSRPYIPQYPTSRLTDLARHRLCPLPHSDVRRGRL